jgi:hypothetical protein
VQFTTRSVLVAAVAMLTASAVAIAPSIQPAPPPTPAPTVQLVAAVQPLDLQEQPPLLTILLNSPLRLLGPAAAPGTLPPPPAPVTLPPPPATTPFAIAPNLANTIDSVYIAVEPWVQYGFEVATAVVRWIPWVGWFAGQIMIFYHFFESMVASGVFNFTDWLRGQGGVVENLVDFGIDVGLAFVWLGLDELAQWVPLPPFCCYPPRPPVQGPFLALGTLAAPTQTAELTMAAAADPSTTDVGKPEMPGNPFKAAGKETAPGQLAEATVADVEAEATVTDANETIAPRINKRAKDTQGEVRETGASTKKAPETAKTATDTAAPAASPSPKTGKKDATSKNDGTPKNDRTDNE